MNFLTALSQQQKQPPAPSPNKKATKAAATASQLSLSVNDKIRHEIAVLITPGMAKGWLITNKVNRILSESRWTAIGLDLLEGRWQYNGAPILFDENGDLMDGQHRLTACVEAAVPFTSDVIRGFPRSVMETVDTGKSRTASDIAGLNGIKNANVAASIAGLALIHKRHGVHRMGNGNCKPSKTEVVQAIRTLPDLEHSVMIAAHFGKRLVAPRILGFSHYIFSRQDRPLAERFFHELQLGSGLSETNSVLHLRERLNANRTNPLGKGRLPDLYIVALFFKAWIAYKSATPVKVLRWRCDGPNPEPFPEIGPIKY